MGYPGFRLSLLGVENPDECKLCFLSFLFMWLLQIPALCIVLDYKEEHTALKLQAYCQKSLYLLDFLLQERQVG